MQSVGHQHSDGTAKSGLERLALWSARLALAASGIVLLLVASKFIGDPVGAAAVSHTSLGSPVAATNMRASFGAFPLGVALVAFVSLAARRRHLAGLAVMATVLGTVLAVRIFGILIDGTLRESLTVLGAETILFLLCILAIAAAVASERSALSQSRQMGSAVSGVPD
jgi:hypothetical protein